MFGVGPASGFRPEDDEDYGMDFGVSKRVPTERGTHRHVNHADPSVQLSESLPCKP
jgi:hypothetical protein